MKQIKHINKIINKEDLKDGINYIVNINKKKHKI